MIAVSTQGGPNLSGVNGTQTDNSTQVGMSLGATIKADNFIKSCNAILQLTFISGFLEFGAVPQHTGPFVSTIWSIFKDIFRFMCIFLVFYVCFVAAMWPLARDGTGLGPSDTFQYLLQLLFTWLVVQPDETAVDTWGGNVELGRLIFYVYAVVCSILLLNMLIAMMNNTYTLVQEDAEGEWCLNWARYMDYYYETSSDNDRRCVTSFLKECSGKTQEQTLAQVSADAEEKSWVDDVRDGVSLMRVELTALSDFVMRKSGVQRVATRHPHLSKLKSLALSRMGSTLHIEEEKVEKEPASDEPLRLSVDDG